MNEPIGENIEQRCPLSLSIPEAKIEVEVEVSAAVYRFDALACLCARGRLRKV